MPPVLCLQITTKTNLICKVQIAGLREVFGQLSEEDDDELHPSQSKDFLTKQEQHLLLSQSRAAAIYAEVDISEPPSRSQTFALCSVYLERVDPIFKVVHGPSLSKYLREGEQYLDRLPGDQAVDALTFAIFYAAVTTLGENECWQQIGESRPSLLAKYRLGLEYALARADYINTTDLTTLQALVIFLVSLAQLSSTTSVMMFLRADMMKSFLCAAMTAVDSRGHLLGSQFG